MLDERYFTPKNNTFKNNELDLKKWSASYMLEKDEIVSKLHSLKLEGRTIKDVKFVSHVYNLTQSEIEDYAYNMLEGLPESEQLEKSEYDSIDSEMEFLRFARIDEPFLILFEDGAQFEIVTQYPATYRMSMNTIPWNVKPGICADNVDASIIFDECIGRTIVELEVEGADHNNLTDKKEEVAVDIILWLDDDTGISIQHYGTCCDVILVDRYKEIVKIPFDKLKKVYMIFGRKYYYK